MISITKTKAVLQVNEMPRFVIIVVVGKSAAVFFPRDSCG